MTDGGQFEIKLYMDGSLVSYEDAKVHILNPTMHYGSGIFEGMSCYDTSRGPVVFRLNEHLKHFLDSARIASIRSFASSLDDLHQAVHQAIRVNGFQVCYIRPLIHMEGPLG